LIEQSARFERLTHEPRAVLVGRPNAGKSTLLNALAGKQRAVVSPTAGTTRDAVWAQIALERGMLRLIDVAGIDFTGSVPAESPGSPDIERKMYHHAARELEMADMMLLVHDRSSLQQVMQTPRRPDLIVFTKSDLAPGAPAPSDLASVCVSSHTGQNLDVLRRMLDQLAFSSAPAGATLALNSRHLAAITEARAALARAAGLVAGGGEFIALELRDALDALGGVLGRVSPDELLGRIFAAFCIGK
jgi:tRNA modification GTPase